MRLPTNRRAIKWNDVTYIAFSGAQIWPSQTSIPAAIAAKLASDYAIDEVTGLAQCVGTLAGILDNYQRCVDRGGNVNCANIAARHIAEIACRSYCTCE